MCIFVDTLALEESWLVRTVAVQTVTARDSLEPRTRMRFVAARLRLNGIVTDDTAGGVCRLVHPPVVYSTA
jgi:hypothetical protein